MAFNVANISMLMLAFGAHSVAHAVNVFDDLDLSTVLVAREAVQTALETHASGKPLYWNVRDVAQGIVIPRRTWRSATGHWCREFEENVQERGGRSQSTVAVRCRAKDGRWKLPGGE